MKGVRACRAMELKIPDHCVKSFPCLAYGWKNPGKPRQIKQHLKKMLWYTDVQEKVHMQEREIATLKIVFTHF